MRRRCTPGAMHGLEDVCADMAQQPPALHALVPGGGPALSSSSRMFR